jgi:hypothetical protein
MRRRDWWVAGVVLLVVVAWVVASVAWPVPEVRTGMTEQEVEALLGSPIQPRIQDEGHSGVAVYSAVPRWLLSRNDWYLITYDPEGRVAHYDRVESGFLGHRRWTRR